MLTQFLDSLSVFLRSIMYVRFEAGGYRREKRVCPNQHGTRQYLVSFFFFYCLLLSIDLVVH